MSTCTCLTKQKYIIFVNCRDKSQSHREVWWRWWWWRRRTFIWPSAEALCCNSGWWWSSISWQGYIQKRSTERVGWIRWGENVRLFKKRIMTNPLNKRTDVLKTRHCIHVLKNQLIKSNHFYCHITTAQVPWWVKFLWACSRKCKKKKKCTNGQYTFTDCTEDNVQNTHTYTQST